MPPSVLSRSVFRSLAANKPIVHSGCLRRQQHAIAIAVTNSRTRQRGRSSPHNAYPFLKREQKRTFLNLGLFKKAPRDAREADLAPGIEVMMHFAKMERARARLPPVGEVQKAVRAFVFHKHDSHRMVEDTQAQLLLQCLRYCLQDSLLETPGIATKFTKRFGTALLDMINRTPQDRLGTAHVELARFLFEDERTTTWRHTALQTYVRVLTLLGHMANARQLVDAEMVRISGTSKGLAGTTDADQNVNEDDALTCEQPSENSVVDVDILWNLILQGHAHLGDRTGLVATLDEMDRQGLPTTQRRARTLLYFHLESSDLGEVQAAWRSCISTVTEQQVSGTEPGSGLTKQIHAVIMWCLLHNELAFGQEIVRDLTRSNPQKRIWDTIFVWAAGTNKGVDEINRMMSVMEQSNARIKNRQDWRLPDTTTINTLVEYAISRNDPYLAERFISLGRDRNIEPDARTYVLQMEYRLGVNDIDGALTAYKNLQSQDLSADSDVPVVNRLISALCKSKRHDFDTIMNVAADLSDRRVRFEPATVSALSILHFSRGETDDVSDLLNTHVFHYSSTERASVRDAIISFCIDDATSTAQSWAAYGILRNIFDEMPREERTQLMTNFLNRRRPDMAVHVFNHMRNHSRADTLPNVQTYISASMGLARLRDLDSLEIIYNQLKLDYNIDITTHLNNALIIAFSACGQPRRALTFWDDIVASKEGPTYNSIHIALRACEKSPFGDLKAQEIWQRLRRTNVELDQSMWASYIAALAGNGDNGLAAKVLAEAAEKGEVDVDVFLCGSWFDACPAPIKQVEVERWIKHSRPEIWHQMEEVGFLIDEWGHRSIKIDRSVAP